jgi:hypothetical protein
MSTFRLVRTTLRAPGRIRIRDPLLRSCYPRLSAIAARETHVMAERHSKSYLLTVPGLTTLRWRHRGDQRRVLQFRQQRDQALPGVVI